MSKLHFNCSRLKQSRKRFHSKCEEIVHSWGCTTGGAYNARSECQSQVASTLALSARFAQMDHIWLLVHSLPSPDFQIFHPGLSITTILTLDI